MNLETTTVSQHVFQVNMGASDQEDLATSWPIMKCVRRKHLGSLQAHGAVPSVCICSLHGHPQKLRGDLVLYLTEALVLAEHILFTCLLR